MSKGPSMADESKQNISQLILEEILCSDMMTPLKEAPTISYTT